MTTVKTLPLFDLEPVDKLVYPDQSYEFDLSSPALSILIDYKEYRPLIIEKTTPIADAAMLMKRTHTNLRIVVNDQEEFVGTISTQDIAGEKPIKITATGVAYSEILVEQVMTPRSEIKAFHYDELTSATIYDVVNTLQKTGHHYCLVVDSTSHSIRGIIDAGSIARRIHTLIDVDENLSFSGIFKAMNTED